MSEWKTYKLGEIAEIIMGQSPAGETCNENGNGIPLLNGPTEFGSHYPTPVQFTIDAKKLSKVDDILFCVRGSTTGKMNWADRQYAIGRGIASIRHKNGKEYKHFLRGIIDSNLKNILGIATGSTFPNISGEQLREFEVLAPANLFEQRQIASILSSLDDKIELNLQMNQTLEAMAQAIFKEWFVNFNYPMSESGFAGLKEEQDKNKTNKKSGKSSNPENQDADNLVDGLPKGWRKEPIDKSIEFLNGLALQGFPPESETGFLPVIKIRELRQGITDNSDRASSEIPKQYIIIDGDILFSWSGSLEVVLWCDGKGALNQHLFKVSSKHFPKWFYYLWTKHFLPIYQSIASDKATTMGHIQRRHLTETIINVPNSEVMELANNVISPIIQKLEENKIQIKTLTQLRDSLLPKLMTGEISLNTI